MCLSNLYKSRSHVGLRSHQSEVRPEAQVTIICLWSIWLLADMSQHVLSAAVRLFRLNPQSTSNYYSNATRPHLLPSSSQSQKCWHFSSYLQTFTDPQNQFQFQSIYLSILPPQTPEVHQPNQHLNENSSSSLFRWLTKPPNAVM